MRTAICPGSFDPVTNGHIDIVSRASKTFDRVIVAVMVNRRKQEPLFSAQERIDMLQQSVNHLPNVEVAIGSGLLLEFARSKGAQAIVKGLRPIQDFEYEWQMGMVNMALDDGIETYFLMSRVAYAYLSSSIVRELASYGGNIDGLVPPVVAENLRRKFAQQ